MLAQKNENIDKACEVLHVLSKDEETRALYLAREMEIHDQVTRLEVAIEKALEKGQRLKALEVSKNLLSMSLNIEMVAKATGLTQDEVAKVTWLQEQEKQ